MNFTEWFFPFQTPKTYTNIKIIVVYFVTENSWNFVLRNL